MAARWMMEAAKLHDGQTYLFHGGRLFDPRLDELVQGVEVLVERGEVKEVSRPDGPSRGPIRAEGARRINLGGHTLMPGLIDAHVHVFIAAPLAQLGDMPLTWLAASAMRLMREMLLRGFTTVRDTAGADWGIKAACDAGLVEAPRLFISGMAISQTGGHGDFRRRTEGVPVCRCCAGLHALTRIVDGVPEMLRAVREELRKGADHIKLMVSGGVASPSDPLESLQFRLDEIEAACQEANNWGKYVCAHAYAAEAIRRAVGSGVRTIEHGNMLDESAARLMAERKAFLVPTLITYDAMHRRGREIGLPETSALKNEEVLRFGLESIAIARRAGVEIGFGTDLLGNLHEEQSREFVIRSRVEKPIEVLRSATLVNARILRREGQPGKVVPGVLGEVVPGACADLIAVDGDPLRNVEVLGNQGEHISMIMKAGRLYKNELSAKT
jgi:imidazolonepropionase-like amidohydrolase